MSWNRICMLFARMLVLMHIEWIGDAIGFGEYND